MSELEWQTDEDANWDDFDAPSTAVAPPHPTTENTPQPTSTTARKLKLGAFFVLLVIFLVSGYQLYSRLQDRAEANLEAMKADILASHELTYEAVLARDSELMANLISGSDRAWVENQLVLIAEDQFYGRPQFGLTWLEEQPESEIIELSPDLSTAIVSTQLTYQSPYSERPTIMVHTAVYKRGEQRWLLAPPDSPENPQNEQFTGEYITAVYPAEEAEQVGRLVADLERTIQNVCNRFVDLVCSPTTHHFNLTFSADPAALWATQNPQLPRELLLPTPQLLGTPLNPPDYRVLYQAYATYIDPQLFDLMLTEDSA